MKGTRLSKQNYCTHCNFRFKGKNTICIYYNQPINEAMIICYLLKPFEKYKQTVGNKSN